MPDATSPTARALLALQAIQTAPGITGDRLALRLDVSDRAVRRYIEILREAGIPVESVSGRYGGYRLGRGARVPPPLTFSTAEALALVMAVLQGWHGSTDDDHPAATALAKIVRVLPAAAAAPAEAILRVRAQNPGDAATIPDPDVTADLAQAADAHRQVRLRYNDRHDMLVDPWAVVVRHGRWYLLGWSHGPNAQRVLRLDRISEVATTGEVFTPPADLDPVRGVEDHLAEGWTYDVEVRIDAPRSKVAPCVPRVLGRLEQTGADSCVLRGSTDNPYWYAEQLAAVPAPFRVVRPDALRATIGALAERLAAAVVR